MTPQKQLAEVYKKLFDVLGKFEGSYIAGGAVVSLILDETPRDYDVWFNTQEDFDKASALLQNIIDKEELGYDTGPILSCQTTAFARSFKLKGLDQTIQFISKRIGTPEKVVTTFDFLHAQAAYLPETEEIYYMDGNSEEFILSKLLMFAGRLDHPTNSLRRLQKFAMRGYTTPSKTLAEVVMRVRLADENLILQDVESARSKDMEESYEGKYNEDSI